MIPITIHGRVFKTKAKLIDYCRAIITVPAIGKTLNRNDKAFMAELIARYHDDPDYKLYAMTHMSTGVGLYGTRCLFIHYENNTVDDVSYIKCISNINSKTGTKKS